MNDSTAATQPANDSSEVKPGHGSPAAQPDHSIVSVLRLNCPQFPLSSVSIVLSLKFVFVQLMQKQVTVWNLILSVLRLHCPKFALSSDCLTFTRNASQIEFNDDSANCLHFYYVLSLTFVFAQHAAVNERLNRGYAAC